VIKGGVDELAEQCKCKRDLMKWQTPRNITLALPQPIGTLQFEEGRLEVLYCPICKTLKIVEQLQSERYFLIIGVGINHPMGACTSYGLHDVHEEEPDAKFYEISEEEFDRFGETMGDSVYTGLKKNWVAESKFYTEVLGYKKV
jgi:hypothetical protein